MTRAADPGLRHEVTEVLDAAASCGLTAIRTWAFCEGDEWNALQPKAGPSTLITLHTANDVAFKLERRAQQMI